MVSPKPGNTEGVSQCPREGLAEFTNNNPSRRVQA
jgi:hypothetical protein